MADNVPTLSLVASSSPAALRPCIVPQFTAEAMAFPVAGFTFAAGGFVDHGFIPVIHWPERVAYRWNRFPRKTKPTAAEALRYAENAIYHLQIRATAKRRWHELNEPSLPFLAAAE